MKNLALGALFVGLMACGGGKNNTDVIIVDSSAGGDGNVTAACNPLMQSGCTGTEKCTWINDQDNPPVGHVGCAPDGTIALGGACTPPPGGPMGYDTCVKGTVCLSGECKQICDNAGGAPTCDTNHECTNYADFFVTGGVTVAGVCDPTCDPLTQDLKAGSPTVACGSSMAAMPSKGCYGYETFSCAPAGMTTWTLTDRQMPRTNSAGNPYLNGCAPGYMPLVYEMTGSMKTLCTGLCAALEIDNTTAHVNNEKGDATASAKLPTAAASAVGNATCGITKKGSEATSICKFLWPSLVDSAGMLKMTPYTDTLGYCVALAHYNYDDDGVATTPNVPFPNCKTLPPRSAATTGDDDDAADWGCQKVANAMFAAPTTKTFQAPALAPAMQNFHTPVGAAVTLDRHVLD